MSLSIYDSILSGSVFQTAGGATENDLDPMLLLNLGIK